MKPPGPWALLGRSQARQRRGTNAACLIVGHPYSLSVHYRGVNPRADAAYPSGAACASHPRVPSGPATEVRGALPSAAYPQQWLSHGSAPVAWSAVGHATTVGLAALTVSPVRPAGPARAALRAHAAPSWNGPREEGGTVRPPAGLGQWRARGDRLPAPRAPARRLRPRPAARGPATRPRPDSPRPPGAPGRAREGAPRTR
jgi:hypothetical protein